MRTITIPAPHIPNGPKGVPEDLADANYLRIAANRIRERRLFGSNLTATVAKLIDDAADALNHKPTERELSSAKPARSTKGKAIIFNA